MCLGGGAPPTPPPLPPAPPPPLPPTPTAPPPDPIMKDVNPQVKRAKDDRGNKNKNQYSKGTGSLKIKLNPKEIQVATQEQQAEVLTNDRT